MSTLTPLEPHYLVTALAAVATLAVASLIGWVLVPRSMTGLSKLLRLAVALASGLLFVSGTTATVVLGRVCYLTVIPVVQILTAVVWRVRKPGIAEEPERWSWLELAWLVVAAGAALWFTAWHHQWLLDFGDVRSFHSDLGYFIQLVDQLPRAKVANGWAVVLGEHLNDGPPQGDTWYHWGAIMLAIAVRGVTGLPAITALLGVASSVMNVALVIAAAAVVRRLNGSSVGRCLLVGAASLVAVQWARAYGLQAMAGWLPYGVVQHLRWTLAQMFSYKFEGVLMLATIAVWHQRRFPLAVLLLFCAGLSAPHTVGAFGAMAGTLGALGLAMRRRAMWQTAAVMIATLLAAWAVIHFGFGGGLPKAEGQSMLTFNFNDLRMSLRAAVIDSAIGLLVGVFSLPGILHLIRARDTQATEETRLLGWMALCGIVGTYAAYSFLHKMTDRFHFVLLLQAILMLPAGVWGLARKVTVETTNRVAGTWLIIWMTVMGVYDLVWLRDRDPHVVWRAKDVAKIQKVLQGRPFGYFAKSDRQWWIPKHTPLASLLESRCMRLNELSGTDIYTRYYGADLPHQLVPKLPGESDEDWPFRFASKLGIRYVLEAAPDFLPVEIRKRAKIVASARGLRLFELNSPAPPP